jgi:hypothetical protein
MKQFKVFASKLRINVLLSCSAAVVLTACGGGNLDAGSEQLSATAASVTTNARDLAAASTAAPAPEVEASTQAAPAALAEAAPAAPAASTEAASPEAASTDTARTANTAGTTGQAADVTTQAFEMTGYDSSQPQPQTEQQPASGAAPN